MVPKLSHIHGQPLKGKASKTKKLPCCDSSWAKRNLFINAENLAYNFIAMGPQSITTNPKAMTAAITYRVALTSGFTSFLWFCLLVWEPRMVTLPNLKVEAKTELKIGLKSNEMQGWSLRIPTLLRST